MSETYGPSLKPVTLANPQAPVKRAAGSLLSPAEKEAITTQATEFEAMFMAQMLQFMWTDIETNEVFGGGHGEDQWRGMMLDEYGKISAKAGSVGLADMVKAEMIRAQERMKENQLAIQAATTTTTDGGI